MNTRFSPFLTRLALDLLTGEDPEIESPFFSEEPGKLRLMFDAIRLTDGLVTYAKDGFALASQDVPNLDLQGRAIVIADISGSLGVALQ